MTTTYLKARQKQRVASSSEWQAANPILLNGEIAIESDSQKMKVGNGNTAYNSLLYFGGSKPITKELTLAAADWEDELYTITDDDITESSVIFFDAPIGVTAEQYKILRMAVIVADSQGDGTLVLRSLGVVPTEDVTVALAIL